MRLVSPQEKSLGATINLRPNPDAGTRRMHGSCRPRTQTCRSQVVSPEPSAAPQAEVVRASRALRSERRQKAYRTLTAAGATITRGVENPPSRCE